MIYLLVRYWIEELEIKLPKVLLYTSTRMMLAAITALLLSIFIGPWFIRKLYALKIGQSIRKEDCPRLGELHAGKKDTPTMGGVLILTSILFSMLIWMDLKSSFTMILFATTVLLGLIGGMDDYLKLKHRNTKGLSGKKKLLGQVFVSLLVASYLIFPQISHSMHHGSWFPPPAAKEEVGAHQEKLEVQNYSNRLYVPFFKEHLFAFHGWAVMLIVFFFILVITGSSNAVNLTDGLDGLAAGCLIMVSVCLALIAFVSNNIDLAHYLQILYIEGSGEIAIFLSACAGACLGFLWYNAHPAEVFMGDIGSLALGGAIGTSAILLKRELLLAVVGGVFVAETLSVILQVGSFKLRNRKRIFLCTPLHHHFEYKGWAETKVVVRFWIIGLLLAIIGIASLKFQ